MPQTQVRVVGSGYTTLHYGGDQNPIAFLDSFNDSGQSAIGGTNGRGWEAITPLGSRHAIEIATSRVLGPGTITASIRELWNAPVWAGLKGLAEANNILQVWEALENDPSPVTCHMRIKTPGNRPNRKKVFHNCTITSIDDGEQVQIGTISVAKNIEIVYTHATYGGGA